MNEYEAEQIKKKKNKKEQKRKKWFVIGQELFDVL